MVEAKINRQYLLRMAGVALFMVGGELIHGFSIALIIGVLVGTYSSIFVASTTTLSLGISQADLMPVDKEGPEIDERP